MKAFSWLAGNKLTHITCNNATFFFGVLFQMHVKLAQVAKYTGSTVEV